MYTPSTLLLALAGLSTAHFNLNFPAARGFDEDKLPTFPCGGQDTVSSTRTPFPLTGGQIALTMGHIDANVEVLIAMGSEATSAFNTILIPTFGEQGLGAFCMTGVDAEKMGAMEGMNATIQVVTNGDPDGGLFNCADITFSKSAVMATADVCRNATGVKVVKASVTGNPNVTSSSSTASSSGEAKKGGAGRLDAWMGGVVVAGLAGVAAVL